MLAAALALLAPPAGPVPSQFRRVGDHWTLFRAGRPYEVKGAGSDDVSLDALKAAGANTIRTWGGDQGKALDAAQARGMTVLCGIWLNKQGDGMDYGSETDRDKQAEAVRADVRKWRDHPALLAWSVGNEMELGRTTPDLFRQIERLAKIVKEEDPRHPVLTVVADMWPEKMALLRAECPSLDGVGVNSYSGLPTLHERMKDWDRPYLITEFSYSIAETTPWGATIEPSGTRKAESIEANYRDAIRGRKLPGSFYFHWSRPTVAEVGFHNAFLRDGSRTPVSDVMTRAWTGRWPRDRAPRIVSSPAPREVAPGASVTLVFPAEDRERGRLTYAWEVLSDDPKKRFVGDFEQQTPTFAQGTGGPAVTFEAPRDPGPYRFVMIVRDGKGGADYASTPFRVR